MKISKILVTLGLILIISLTYSQENEETTEDEYIKMAGNISITPGFSYGESKAKGKKIENTFNFNVFAGKSHRLDGMEIGYFWNHNIEYAKGFQIGGLLNSVDGNFSGFQSAGLVNYAGNDVHGVQFAGISNFTKGSLKGASFAGIANYTGKDAKGAQFSGSVNYNEGNIKGFQGAGTINVVQGNVSGVQFAGTTNYVRGTTKGWQSAGCVNVTSNLASGVQTSGFLNYAKNVSSNSWQIGVVNISEKNEGVPIGLFSYVKEQGVHYDVWGDETGFTNLGIRTGNKKYGNTLFAGIQVDSDDELYTLGYAFDRKFSFNNKGFVSLGISHQGIIEGFDHFEYWDEDDDEEWDFDWHALNKFELLFGLNLGVLDVYAGPTYNIFLSETNDGDDLAPYSLSESKEDDVWVRSWIGAKVGIRY